METLRSPHCAAVCLAVLALVALAGAGCSNEPNIVTPTKACSAQSDCPSDQICITADKKACPGAGVSCNCASLNVVGGCKTDSDCQGTQICLSNGSCAACECETAADCGAAQVCTECQCLGTECTDGNSQECFADCHRGDKECIKGQWTPCSAPPKSDEACGDGIDNDCNGLTDDPSVCNACDQGTTQACTSSCGDGVQHCIEGLWGECDAPQDCICAEGETDTKSCGNCGQAAGNCGPDSQWLWSDICTGEGACTPGQEEQQPCGSCGAQVRVCSAECTWGEWTKCGEDGECVPNETQQQGCGNCGSQDRTCTDQCTWGDWGSCQAGAGCQAGEEQFKSCGQCGTQVSTCNGSCEWGAYGSCSKEGVCTPGEQQEESCGNCGKKTRMCSNQCTWGQWTSCLGAGECSAGDTQNQACGETNKGLCEFGEQVRTCNASCKWTPWGSCLGGVFPKSEICGNDDDEDCDGFLTMAPDNYESNDSCQACYDIGTDPNKILTGSFDNPADERDYYCFTAVDGTSIPGFDESIKATVTKQANGVDADLILYKGTADCQSGTPKASSIGPNKDKEIDWGGSFGTDDGGLWIIEVRNYGSTGCQNTYELLVNGLN